MGSLGWVLISVTGIRTGVLVRRDWDTKRQTPRHLHAQTDDYTKSQGEDGHPQAKARGLRRNKPCQHLHLGLPASRTMRK